MRMMVIMKATASKKEGARAGTPTLLQFKKWGLRKPQKKA
jgi:hypothetical protein